MSDVGKINGTGPVNPNSQNQNVEQRRAEEEMPNSIMETSDTSAKDTDLGQKLADKTLVGKMANYLEENKEEIKETFEDTAKNALKWGATPFMISKMAAKESNVPPLKELVEKNGGPGGVLGMSVKDLHEDIDKYKKE